MPCLPGGVSQTSLLRSPPPPSQPPRTVGAPTGLGMLLGSWCCDAGIGCSLPPWP